MENRYGALRIVWSRAHSDKYARKILSMVEPRVRERDRERKRNIWPNRTTTTTQNEVELMN